MPMPYLKESSCTCDAAESCPNSSFLQKGQKSCFKNIFGRFFCHKILLFKDFQKARFVKKWENPGIFMLILTLFSLQFQYYK